MQTHQIEQYREKFKDAQLKIDSYLIRRMNLIASQTTIRMGDYNMLGALAMLSFAEAQLVAVLSPNEASHFQRFTGKPSTLLLAFERPGIKEPVRYHLRVSLASITELPNRANICLVRLVLKMIPPEFLEMMCDLFDDITQRRLSYEQANAESLAIDPKDFHIAAIKPRGEFYQGAKRLMADIRSVSVRQAVIHLASWPFPEDAENRFSLKLVGSTGSFVVGARFAGDLPQKPGEYSIELDFNNELIFNIEEWRSRLAIRARAAKSAAGQ